MYARGRRRATIREEDGLERRVGDDQAAKAAIDEVWYRHVTEVEEGDRTKEHVIGRDGTHMSVANTSPGNNGVRIGCGRGERAADVWWSGSRFDCE